MLFQTCQDLTSDSVVCVHKISDSFRHLVKHQSKSRSINIASYMKLGVTTR